MPENIVVDTNIVFHAVYKPESPYAKLFIMAIEGEVFLFSPDSVKEELKKVISKLLPEHFLLDFIESLPTKWIQKEIYSDFMEEADKLIEHNKDVPIVACALLLNCGVITMDTDFDNKHLKKRIKLWKISDIVK